MLQNMMSALCLNVWSSLRLFVCTNSAAETGIKCYNLLYVTFTSIGKIGYYRSNHTKFFILVTNAVVHTLWFSDFDLIVSCDHSTLYKTYIFTLILHRCVFVWCDLTFMTVQFHTFYVLSHLCIGYCKCMAW